MFRSSKVVGLVIVAFSGYTNAASLPAGEDSQPGMKTGLETNVEIGVGYDSNIYRAPSSPYMDYADVHPTLPDPNSQCTGFEDPNTPGDTDYYCQVNPQTKSGIYVPVEVNLGYIKGTNAKNYLVSDYKFDSESYVDSQYDNANNYAHRFRLGDEYVFGAEGSRAHSVYAGGLLEHKKRLYLDRDSGEEQTSSAGIDISSRYTYNSAGAELAYQNHVSALQYDLEANWYERDYEDPAAVSEYDHTYYLVGGDVKYALAKHSKLTLGYQYYVYDYDERPSRGTDGNLSTVVDTTSVLNPPREYQYDKFDVTLRQRISKAWLAYFDYERKLRTDKYVGYDDYTKDLFKVRLHYDLNKRNKIKFSMAYWERDYPNAYAFDNQTLAIEKQYDGVDVKLATTTQLDKTKSIAVDFTYVDENSTDLRYDYERFKAFVAFLWEY